METLIIFALPTCIFADIKIEVICKDAKHRTVNYNGSSNDIISNTERHSFNLTDENLKRAIKTHFGLRPDDVFLKEPTPWGNLYTLHNWKPVTRSLMPHTAEIKSFSSIPIVVLTQVFNNTSWKTAKFKAPIRQLVNNTIHSYWMKLGSLTIADRIHYKFNMTAASFTGRLLASYNSKWGENVMISESVIAGSESNVQVVIAPKQTIVAELIATRDTLEVHIHYLANLFGSAVANYEEMYEGHHFWSLDINSVLESEAMQMALPSTEIIVLEYYTDSKVVFRNFDTKEVLDTARFKLYTEV